MFLALFFFRFFPGFSYLKSYWCPLIFNASWYIGFVLSNISSLLEISGNLLLMVIGRFLMIIDGWFVFPWMYAAQS